MNPSVFSIQSQKTAKKKQADVFGLLRVKQVGF